MAKGRKKAKPAPLSYAEPTPEQFAAGTFERAGLKYIRVPVIITLANTGKISQRQFNGLSRYRDVAIAADRSEIRCPMDFSVRGDGGGLPHYGVRMNIELGYLERELGSLADIARAVAVNDMTPSQWAIHKAGSVMRVREVGRRVLTLFEPRREAYKIALVDIRFAGERLAAAIGA